jgi:hypothetical protein
MSEPYARVYFSIWRDERFVRIREDYALLGVWLDLLMRAEAAWPEDVAIPRRTPPEALAAMVEDGVIDLHPCDTYRVHGLDPERERRSQHGRDAIARRWAGRSDTPTTTPGTTQPLLAPRSRTSPLSSTSPLELAVPSVEPILDALMGALGTVPTPKVMDWADQLVAEYGEDATIRALGTAAVEGPVKVISRAESALKESVIRRARSDAKRKEAELSAARQDRMAARVAAAAVIPNDPRSLAEIMKGLEP